MTRNTQFLLNVLLTLAAYFTLCAVIIAVTHSGYCRCGTCEDCKLRGSCDEETTMTQATVSTTTWPRVALFNYFAVPMPFTDKSGLCGIGSTEKEALYDLEEKERGRGFLFWV